MAGNNPRKFKDRIALLNQKQAESTEQFEVSSVILIKRWESEIYTGKAPADKNVQN